MKTSFDEKALQGLPFKQVIATQLIRSMRGASRSVLVLADDLLLYIVKFANNPGGPNVLANEHLAKQLRHAVSLPSAREVIVYVPEFLLSDRCEFWRKASLYRWLPRPGIHYGTQYAGTLDGTCQLYDVLPRALIHRVTNRADFLGMLILDIWANHQDHRQAVFSVATVGRLATATFIDDSDMFGGPQNVFDDSRCRALYLDPEIYSGLFDTNIIEDWKCRIYEAAPAVLLRSLEYLPQSWYNENHKSVRMILTTRLAELDRLIQPFTEVLRSLGARA